jgi:Uma2 family endonuclease
LRPLVRASGLGRYFGDGMRLRNVAANLSTDPDGLFYFHASLQNGQIQEVTGRLPGGVVEYLGSPDMVLEVVSESSVEKDMVRLPQLYQAAQVREFWRVDVRNALGFEILRLTPSGYAPTQLADGWWRSDVFARDFRLAQNNDAMGRPEFVLEVR